MALDIVATYLNGLSLVEWLIFGFIGTNALIAAVCLIERSVQREPARIKE